MSSITKRILSDIIDTLLLATVVLFSGIFWNGVLLRYLIALGLMLSAVEIYSGLFFLHSFGLSSNFVPSYLVLLILVLSTISTYSEQIQNIELMLIVYSAVAADAGGLIFGKICKNAKKPRFLAKISPNKTYIGYVGEIVCSYIIGFVFCLLFSVKLSHARIFCILATPFVAVAGDLLASLAKRSMKIKDSGFYLNFFPFLRELEAIVRSRHGFLDCFDSISMILLFYSIIHTVGLL